MEITIDRLKHSLSVARKMRSLAIEDPQRYPVDPNEAYVLGLVHDIGYDFSDEQKEHAHKGGELLEAQGYKYWKEVYYHGVCQTEYDSVMLRLLNYVDMITGPTGEYVTIRERIEDIAQRYGMGSWQEEEAIKLTNRLGYKV